MNNFFKDYTNNPEQIEVIKESFSGLFNILQSQVQEISRNNNISKILTYRRIQFQKIDISEAVYSLSDLLNDESIMSIIGVQSNISFNQKMEIWNSMTPREKAHLLDVANYSILLTSFSHLLNEDEFMARKFNVIDFELTDLSNNKYIENIDYVFYDNKLFLLKQFESDDIYRQKYLILKDIVIDINTTEDSLGEHLNIPYNFEFTKTDYTETLKGFAEAAAGGPTLSNLSKAINRYKALDGVRVYDRNSSTNITSHFWGTDGYVGTLTDFDFIVAMPVSLIYKPEKLEYIRKFFEQIKPSYTNFIFTPELGTKDELPLKFSDDILRIEGERQPFVDNIKSDDNTSALNIFKTSDYMNKNDSHYHMPTSYINDYYDARNRDSFIKAVSSGIADIIEYEEKYNFEPHINFKDRVHVRRWIADGYYLDKDYFDLKYLTDPFKGLTKAGVSDSFKDFKDIGVVDGILNSIDLIAYRSSINSKLTLDVFDGILVAYTDAWNNTMLVSDVGVALDKIILSSIPKMKAENITSDKLNASDNSNVAPYYNPKDNIEYIETQRNYLEVEFKERKVYFPFNPKHDEFYFDTDRFFDPMIMTSSVNPFIELSFVSNIKYSDTVSIERLYSGLLDIITYKEINNKILRIDFSDKAKRHDANIEDIYTSDSNEFLDIGIITDSGHLKLKNDVLFNDLIRCNEQLASLNSKILYDKIIAVNDVTKISSTGKKDNIGYAVKANILKCDSIFSCDYADESNMRLDSAPEGYTEESVNEVVELVLIPKS